MTIKVKQHGPRFKTFEIWTKMAKVAKPQGPKWQFTLLALSKLPFCSLWFGHFNGFAPNL
ncbi:hypothetical protein Hanom_Chr00s000007g01614631 [Helianthus anomalus]